MTTLEQCPRCATRFPGGRALVSQGLRVGRGGLFSRGPEVRCPQCWHVSEARNLRLFGVLPVTALRWVVLALLAVCVLVLWLQKHG